MKEIGTVCAPDLSERPYGMRMQRDTALSADALYRAWTKGFGVWFAAPASVLMKAEVNAPFFFETDFHGKRHPHYGRFLRLVPGKLIEMTWLNEEGTRGAETVVTVELAPSSKGTLLALTHAGFPSEALRDRHKDAWPGILAAMEEKLRENQA